jgi:hypothetical protein
MPRGPLPVRPNGVPSPEELTWNVPAVLSKLEVKRTSVNPEMSYAPVAEFQHAAIPSGPSNSPSSVPVVPKWRTSGEVT